MTIFSNLKKLGVNSTVLATSIALVACGGGGSDGYFNNDDNSSNSGGDNSSGNESTDNSAQIAESLNVLELKDAAGNTIANANDNSVVKFSVQVLNSDKGGIANKAVRLSISDSEKIGVTSANSLVTTSEGGVASFDLNVPSLATSSGKVQLTATVDGTTIKQVYTLNISKKSTVTSNYNISIEQGVILDLPKGSASITARVTDSNGGAKANQTVTLALPEAMIGKFSISSGSTVVTNAQGEAKFTITANPDLTDSQMEEQFAAKSQSLQFKLIDEFQAQKVVPGVLTFKDIRQIVMVQKLEIIKADAALAAQGGLTTVKVRAKNSNDEALSGKLVKLSFIDKSESYGVSIEPKEQVTDANGYATFTIKSNSSYPIALSQQGINLKAVYADNNEIFAQDTISVITNDTDASDKLALQRLEIASSYKINAKDDQVTITVQGINNQGQEATKGKVSLTLNKEATANGITFDGSAEQEFKNGYVTYTLKSNAKTEAAVTALIQAGITATFTSDNNLTNSIKIAVEDEAKSEEKVNYLAIDPINSSFDHTVDQKIQVKVKAIGVEGSPLNGESVKIAMPNLPVADLQALGLSLSSAAIKNTSSDGYATFEYSYKVNNANRDRQLELLKNGIILTATAGSVSSAQQSITLNFKAPTEQNSIDLDYLDVQMPGSIIVYPGAAEQTLQVSVKAIGTDGKAFANQKVGLGLNDAALGNGVSLSSASGVTTDANGNAVFSLKVKANNATEAANLVANGITVAVRGNRLDGSAYTLTRKIDVAAPAVVLPNLANLNFEYDIQTVSVLGGEVKVKVKAIDEDGNLIPNTSLSIALSTLAGSRVSLSDSSLNTNSKGEAEFTVRVSEGDYDPNLIKNGITFAVVGTSPSNGDRIQQTGTIQVAIPKDSVNLRLTADNSSLELGKSYQLQVAVKDELGANTAYPVNLTLNDEALAAGVKLSSDSVLTSANGQVPVTITLPKEMTDAAKQVLLNAGIKIKGSITNPKGEKLEALLNFSVYEAINTNILDFTVSKENLNVEGDRSIVSVLLTDINGQPLRNQLVNLAANNAATIIIGTPGGGHPTNTSLPQSVMTDSNGNAFFSVEIDGATVDGDLLIASGIELTATHINEAGAVATQIKRLEAIKTNAQVQPAQYSLRIATNKQILNVREDSTEVTVTLVDLNGGGVANKYVELAVINQLVNGAIIEGPSGLTTDANGQATFTVKVDENARADGYSATAFDTDNLRLNATYKEPGFTNAVQVRMINVVQAAVENPVAAIVIGVNPTETGVSSDGVYYTRNLSVSVVDFDGKPLANQKVEMDITPTTYFKGQYIWALAPEIGSASPKVKWVAAGESYYYVDPTNTNIYYNDDGVPTDNKGTPNNTLDDVVLTPIANPIAACRADSNGLPVGNIPVKVPTFLGQGATATYTTDKDGKFDFTIRYPKIYAQWLNVQIGASSEVASLPTRTTYGLGLPSVTTDYSSNGTYGPNLTSPYGLGNCP